MSWKIRYIDYPAQYRKIREELLSLIDSTLSAGDVMMRQQLEDFEAHFAEFVGSKYAIGVNSGTDALQLAVSASGVKPGDEVITTSHTMVATAAAIHHNGATPILVDVNDDHTMDMHALDAAITPRTKAIIPVHLNGRLCDMEHLMAIAKRHKIAVIEDTAQALGGSFNGAKAGTIGLAGCFSFYPAKILGTYGDGGAVVTDSYDIAQKIRLLRNHGRADDGDTPFWSFNSRLDNLHAVILDLKLKYLPEWIARRREIASLYHKMLSGLPLLRLPPPPVDEGPHYDVFQNYEIETEDRDGLVKYLNSQGIEVMLPWGGKAVHQFPSLGLSSFRDTLPRTERIFKKVMMIPMHCELTDIHVEYVAKKILEFHTK